MPELPEVEITARRLGGATAGATVESTLAPGLNALKTYDPPLSILEGRRIEGLHRRGKLFLLDLEDELTLLIHLMSAGRLQLFDRRASLRDRTSRFLLRLPDGSELRLREFGTKQRAWVKLLRAADVETDDTLSALGPEAWPDPPPFVSLLDAPRPLHALLRDQHVIAGIGRSWVDEILHDAKLSPFKRGADLDADEAERLRTATIEQLTPRRAGIVVTEYTDEAHGTMTESTDGGGHFVEGGPMEALVGKHPGRSLQQVLPGLLAPPLGGHGFEGHRQGLRYSQV